MDKKLVYDVVRVISDAIDEDSEEKIAKVLNEGLANIGVDVKVTVDEVRNAVESFSGMFIGADELIYLVFKKMGCVVFKTGRANVVVTCCSKQSEKFSTEVPGVCLYVIGDPDSGLVSVDEVYVTGYRFGLESLLVNDRPLINVHRFF